MNAHTYWQFPTALGSVYRDDQIGGATGGMDLAHVVVIDYGDAEQVKRFADVYAIGQGLPEAGPAILREMGRALREFANPQPPKPDEPTGLGAVVIDADGFRWVRIDNHEGTPWANGGRFSKPWHGIEDPTVVSEGISA